MNIAEVTIMVILVIFLYCTTLFVNQRTTKAATSLDSTAWQKGSSWNSEHRFNISSPIPLPLWGSYRPGIYFGMKTRSPVSMSTGILWATTRGGRNNFRHDTNQDELTQFEWVKHDGKHYGQQNLLDTSYNMKINTTFVVRPVKSESISNLNDESNDEIKMGMRNVSWVQRISVKSIDKDVDSRKSLLFYLGYEGMEGKEDKMEFISDISIITSKQGIQLPTMKASKGMDEKSENYFGLVNIIGKSSLTGWFRLELTVRASITEIEIEKEEEDLENNYFDISYLGMNCGDVNTGVEILKENLSSAMYEKENFVFTSNGILQNKIENLSNFIVVQIKSDSDFVLDSVFYDNIDVRNVQELEKLSLYEMNIYTETLLSNNNQTIDDNSDNDDNNNNDNKNDDKKKNADNSDNDNSNNNNKNNNNNDHNNNDDNNDNNNNMRSLNMAGEIILNFDNKNKENTPLTSLMKNNVVDSNVINRWIEAHENNFNKKFDRLYKLSSKKDSDENNMFLDSDIEAGKRVLSSLLGGIGYFYGSPRYIQLKERTFFIINLIFHFCF